MLIFFKKSYQVTKKQESHVRGSGFTQNTNALRFFPSLDKRDFSLSSQIYQKKKLSTSNLNQIWLGKFGSSSKAWFGAVISRGFALLTYLRFWKVISGESQTSVWRKICTFSRHFDYFKFWLNVPKNKRQLIMGRSLVLRVSKITRQRGFR